MCEHGTLPRRGSARLGLKRQRKIGADDQARNQHPYSDVEISYRDSNPPKSQCSNRQSKKAFSAILRAVTLSPQVGSIGQTTRGSREQLDQGFTYRLSSSSFGVDYLFHNHLLIPENLLSKKDSALSYHTGRIVAILQLLRQPTTFPLPALVHATFCVTWTCRTTARG